MMKPLASALETFVSWKQLGSEMDVARIWRSWPDIIGSRLAEMARPLGRRRDALIIGVEDSLVMQELTYFSEEIRERIGEFLGWQPFDKVKFELLEDRTPLNEVQVRHEARLPEQHLPDEEEVGSLLDVLPSNSSFRSCYEAYVRMIKALQQDTETDSP
jgi:hypothetical protein